MDNGDVISNDLLTFEPVPPKSYAFCSDTVYSESIIAHLQNVDVLYHESTFLQSEAGLAAKTMHSTAREAATIAYKAGVKHLLLGHYSTRYSDLSLFKSEAQEIFPDILLADDGV